MDFEADSQETLELPGLGDTDLDSESTPGNTAAKGRPELKFESQWRLLEKTPTSEEKVKEPEEPTPNDKENKEKAKTSAVEDPAKKKIKEPEETPPNDKEINKKAAETSAVEDPEKNKIKEPEETAMKNKENNKVAETSAVKEPVKEKIKEPEETPPNAKEINKKAAETSAVEDPEKNKIKEPEETTMKNKENNKWRRLQLSRTPRTRGNSDEAQGEQEGRGDFSCRGPCEEQDRKAQGNNTEGPRDQKEEGEYFNIFNRQGLQEAARGARAHVPRDQGHGRWGGEAGRDSTGRGDQKEEADSRGKGPGSSRSMQTVAWQMATQGRPEDKGYQG